MEPALWLLAERYGFIGVLIIEIFSKIMCKRRTSPVDLPFVGGCCAYRAGNSPVYAALKAAKAGQCRLNRSLSRRPVLISRAAR